MRLLSVSLYSLGALEVQDVQPLAREPLHLQLNLTREDGDGLKSTQIRRRPVRSVASGLFTHSDPVSPSPTPSPVSYNAPRTALYRVYVIALWGTLGTIR
jgi:hypothetical protein